MTTADYIRAILRIARCSPERWASLPTARKGKGLEYASQRVAVPLTLDGAVDAEPTRGEDQHLGPPVPVEIGVAELRDPAERAEVHDPELG